MTIRNRSLGLSWVIPAATAPLLLAAAPPQGGAAWDALPPLTANPAAILLASAAHPRKEAASVTQLLEENLFTLDAAGRQERRHHFVFRIDAESAISGWGSIEAAWSPWYEERPAMRARVITPDGKVHLLDAKTIGEYSANEDSPQVYDDRKKVTAPLPKLAIGAIAEVEIVTRETAPIFRAGGFHSINLAPGVPLAQTRVVVDAPQDLLLHWQVKGHTGAEPVKTIAGGRQIITLNLGPQDPLKPQEPYLPTDLFVHPAFSFSTVPSWAEAARAYEELVESKLKGIDLSAWAQEAVGGLQQPSEKISALLARLTKEVRYVGVEFGECAIVPHTPAETLQRGFGDCKDKATLLVGLLRTVGIKAHVALINAGYTTDVDPDMPGIGGFDHAIVYIPTGAPGLGPTWIDPTHEFARAGELPLSDQGRLVLVAAVGTTALMATPEWPLKNWTRETREVFFADSGKARVVETTEVSGAAEMDLRSSFTGAEEKKARESLKKYVKDTYLAKDLGLMQFSASNDLKRPFTIKVEALESGVTATDFQNAAVAVNRSPLLSSLVTVVQAQARADHEDEKDAGPDPKPRKSDLKIPDLYTREWAYRLVPPSGFVMVTHPEDSTRKIGAATLIETYKAGPNGEFLATYRLECLQRRWTAEEVNKAREFIKEFETKKVVVLSFDHAAEAHLAAGRVKEAVETARRLALAEPKKASPQVHLSRALLASGLGEAARLAAKEAVELEPDSAPAHQSYGWILQHNLIGRRFAKGWDQAASVREHRRAVELDPKEWAKRADLGILLEHNSKGTRYGAGADLEAALKEHQYIQKELKVDNMNDNLEILLVRLGRFQEAHDFAEKTLQSANKHVWMVLTTALLKGIDPAVREAENLVADAGQRKTKLLSVGETLLQMRYYPQAAAMLQEGSRGTEQATQTQPRAELIAKVQRADALKLDPKDPRTVVKRFLAAVMADDLDPKVHLGLLTTPLRVQMEKATNLEDFQKGFRSAFNPTKVGGLTRELALDFALSVVPYSLDGDDAKGYRIKVQGSNQGGAIEEVYYVVKENNEFRISILDGFRSSYGIEALRQLSAGNLPGARATLDKIREQLHLGGGDDPLDGHPFARFWTRGQEGSPDDIRHAAAALMSFDKEDSESVAILRKGRAKATDEATRLRFDVTLALAYSLRRNWKDHEPLSLSLIKAYPDSLTGFRERADQLQGTKRFADLIQYIDDRLKKYPEDPELLTMRAGTLGSMGRGGERDQLVQSMTEKGTVTAGILNNQAWGQVVDGAVTARTLETIRRSLQMREHSSSQHTLAAVLAELDRTTEARDTLWLEMANQGLEEPSGNEWYVLGRIAEKLKEPEAAFKCYTRVKAREQDQDDPGSCFTLAQKRLAVLAVKR